MNAGYTQSRWYLSYLLHRISSDPSVQSNLPSQTYDLGIQSPLLQVAWSYWHTCGGLVTGCSTAWQLIRHYESSLKRNTFFLSSQINSSIMTVDRTETKKKRTLLDVKDDVHLAPRGRWWITHGFADVASSVLELDVGYLQATVDVSAAGRQWKAVAANPTYSGT